MCRVSHDRECFRSGKYGVLSKSHCSTFLMNHHRVESIRFITIGITRRLRIVCCIRKVQIQLYKGGILQPLLILLRGGDNKMVYIGAGSL
jgi:hypothetical protein